MMTEIWEGFDKQQKMVKVKFDSQKGLDQMFSVICQLILGSALPEPV
jgi:hypothetical protein